MRHLKTAILISILLMVTSGGEAAVWTVREYMERYVAVLKMIQDNHTLKATKEALTIEQHASSENSQWGWFITNDVKGHLFQQNGEFHDAINHYSQSLQYAPTTIDSTHVFLDLATCSRRSHDYSSAEAYLTNAANLLPRIDRSNGFLNDLYQHNEVDYYTQRCLLYFDTGAKANFKTYYQKLKACKTIPATRQQTVNLIEVYNQVIDDNLEHALSMCITFWPDSHFRVRSTIYRRMGNYKDAAKAWNDDIFYNDTVNSAGQKIDVEEISAELGLNEIKSSNRLMAINNSALQLNLANLKLGQTRLELEKARQNAILQKEQQRNDQLSIDHRNAQLSMLRSKARKDAIETKLNSEKQSRTALYNTIILIMAVLLIISLSALAIYHHRLNKRLLVKNDLLRKAHEKALQSEANKTAFMQHVSHEVRTPLNSILGFAQLLNMPGTTDDRESMAEMQGYIATSHELMKNLLQDITLLSAIADGTVTIAREKTSINSTIRQVVDELQGRCADGVTMSFTSTASDSYFLITDRKLFTVILRDVITNACKFTEHGSITVNAAPAADDGISISVTDTGRGISAEYAEAIFERFYKIDSFTQGFGIGLSTSRDLARLLGGNLTLDTSYTQGARFIITIGMTR